MEHIWLVSKDAEVEVALNHPDLHVRPPDEPVPKAMRGALLGDVFARLARMNEGPRHDELRERIVRIIDGWDTARVCALARDASRTMPAREVGAYVVAVMSGLTQPEKAMPLIHDFAEAIAGGASDEAIARGVDATPRLLELLPNRADVDERANRLGLLFQAYADRRSRGTAGHYDAPLGGVRRKPLRLAVEARRRPRHLADVAAVSLR